VFNAKMLFMANPQENRSANVVMDSVHGLSCCHSGKLACHVLMFSGVER
jgi:hypothetical protein